MDIIVIERNVSLPINKLDCKLYHVKSLSFIKNLESYHFFCLPEKK
jgi:hypothetical protein